MISIRNDFKQDHTSREAGEKLRLLILESRECITIDFSEVVIASASFFDEGIAKLIDESWTKKDFEKKIVLKNIFRRDLQLLVTTCEIRGIKNIQFSHTLSSETK